MQKYTEVLKRVMGENVTIEDWKKFRELHNLQVGENPTEEEFERWKAEFVNAAHNVSRVLSEEDRVKDIILVLAFEELTHPEKFSE